MPGSLLFQSLLSQHPKWCQTKVDHSQSLTGVLFEYSKLKLVWSPSNSDTVWINYIQLRRECYLIHGCDATTASYHTYILDFLSLHFPPVLFIAYLELRVPMIYYVTTKPRYLHLRSLLHPVNVLCEQSSCRVLKVSQVYFDEKVNVSSINDPWQRMIESVVFFYFASLLVHDLRLKL